MSKKHWIYIKRGLSEDTKHRSQMGEAIWLYMHIIDRADWEMGIAYDWRDGQEAADMGMSVDTLRSQRQKLEKYDYIRCLQKQRGQDIKIMEWKNPRDYGSETKNPRSQSLNESIPTEDKGGIQSLNHRPSQVKTLTLDSESESISKPAISLDLEKSDMSWSVAGDKSVTQKQIDRLKAVDDFENMIEKQLLRVPLKWSGFRSQEQDGFRAFLKDEAQPLEKFLDWWIQDEWRQAHPPANLNKIMTMYPQAFVNINNKPMSLEEQGWR
jgi:hypothetical protein